MTPKDFQTLSEDGAQFESLVCQLLESMGYRIVEGPGVGPDRGRDILIERRISDYLDDRTERVVVQCKHLTAVKRTAVAPSQIAGWQDTMSLHRADGYLLVTSTRVTDKLISLFAKFSDDRSNGRKWANCWDVDSLIGKLYRHPEVQRSFFPMVGPLSLSTPPEAVELAGQLQIYAAKADELFDKGDWDGFAERVNQTRESLGIIAREPKHFELNFHFKRLP